jgi:GNAT superfamily N-acetyltransferase
MVQTLGDQIGQFNMRLTGDFNWTPVVVVLRDDSNQLQGGIAGDIWGGWLHISMLFVNEELRSAGWGSKLLLAAEEVARSTGCRRAYLETFSFQARPFYEKHGYTVFATLEDQPPGHTFYFMRKTLP